MKASEILAHLVAKKNSYNCAINTTNDPSQKKLIMKKYIEIRRMVREMDDLQLVSWYYKKLAQTTELRREAYYQCESYEPTNLPGTITFSLIYIEYILIFNGQIS
jgi:hypothetical protein